MRKIGRNVTRLNRPGMYRGHLAEDYDGIGQYVMVALSGSSVASAYKARVASGDFGGSRIIPKGTPVTIIYDRGKIEVLLGNIPRRCDPFNRITDFPTGGWGVGPYGPWLFLNQMGELNDLSLDQSNYAWDDGLTGFLSWHDSDQGNDPVQGLHFADGLEYPIKIYYEMQTTNLQPGRESEVNNNQLYIGPYFYFDVNAYLVFTSLWDSSPQGNVMFVTTSSQAGYNWPMGSASADEDGLSIEESLPGLCKRILIDENGVYGKFWPKLATEPTEWLFDREWSGSPPPRHWFRYVYLDNQAFNTSYPTQPRLMIDNFCLEHGGGRPIGDFPIPNYGGDPATP